MDANKSCAPHQLINCSECRKDSLIRTQRNEIERLRAENERLANACDRDGCQQTEMQCDPYTIRGGYGSTVMDCEERHFCSLKCLREWVNTGEFKDCDE